MEIALIATFPLLLIYFAGDANAYNAFSHEQITRSAFEYLRSHPHAFSETDQWMSLGGKRAGLMEETLVRAAVDTDFKSDVWLGGWFHKPFTGARTSTSFAMFTRLMHFIVVNQRGDYWQSDGYAYRHGSHENNDAYLSTPSCTVVGKLSHALGGNNPAFPQHGIDLGTFNEGFEGRPKDWHEMFYGNNDADDAVFPPANVPAQAAFDAMLRSQRNTADITNSWTENLPLVTGIFSTGHLSRHYWRGEVTGLPNGLDLLGVTLHMAQDVTVPQHALGTSDWCHQELEDLADSLDCNTTKHIDITPYNQGNFGGSVYSQCHALYDDKLIAHAMATIPALNPAANIAMGERLREIAFHSSRWAWGDPRDFNSDDDMGTVLPNGREFTADHCSGLLKHREVRNQLRYQYNVAIAASVMIFELAAHDYEAPRAQARQQTLAVRLFNLFHLAGVY
ncbi:MAG: hypothetical protein HY074_01560 [Deltaproteobacteria bacterium]|nr:hypothetical protein [Deltaproteobacteria bacterium]